MNPVLIVLGLLALAWLAWYWCNQSRKCQMAKNGWTSVTPAGADIRSLNNRDFQLNAWNRNWRLGPEGAFRFKAEGQGLVVALQTCGVTADDWSDQGEGYAIVLDNGDCDRRLSFVSRLPYMTLPTDGSKQNQGFRFRDGWYWVQYKDGLISCGLGRELGHNKIVTCQPHAPLPGIRFFGFGCRNDRTDEGASLACISQVEIFESK